MSLLGSALTSTLARPVLSELIATVATGMRAIVSSAHFSESQAGAAPQGRKRRGRRSGSEQSTASGAEEPPTAANSETAVWIASTKLLRRIVESCGVELKEAERLEVDRAVVGWLMQHGAGSEGLGYVPAMASVALRRELYATMAASLACPVGGHFWDKESGGTARDRPGGGGQEAASSGRVLPHLQPIARQLFQAGCKDASPSVRSVCSEGLRLCMNLAQPRARPLHFPLAGAQVSEPVVAAASPPPPSGPEPVAQLSAAPTARVPHAGSARDAELTHTTALAASAAQEPPASLAQQTQREAGIAQPTAESAPKPAVPAPAAGNELAGTMPSGQPRLDDRPKKRAREQGTFEPAAKATSRGPVGPGAAPAPAADASGDGGRGVGTGEDGEDGEDEDNDDAADVSIVDLPPDSGDDSESD